MLVDPLPIGAITPTKYLTTLKSLAERYPHFVGLGNVLKEEGTAATSARGHRLSALAA